MGKEVQYHFIVSLLFAICYSLFAINFGINNTFAKTKFFLAVNNSVILGVQTSVCAYAKLKLGFHHKKIDSKKFFEQD